MGRLRRLGLFACATAVVLTLAGCRETEADGKVTSEQEGDSSGAVVDDGGAVMPNVVCMNLQSAQDEIQENGVFLSRSVDATGQDRMQIRDRNWLVVDQSPARGTHIGEGDAVLSVVKEGEASACDANVELVAAADVPETTTTPPSTELVPSTPLPPTTTTATSSTVPVVTPPATQATVAMVTTTAAPPPPPTVAFIPPAPQECDPNYQGACVPIASDVDCAGGSGNGPAYVHGPVFVIGTDIYGLDGNDNDGIGCE